MIPSLELLMNTVYVRATGEAKGWKRYCYQWVNDRIGRVNYMDIWASDIKYAREKVRRLKNSSCRAKMISAKVYDAAMNKIG